ncbi:MAG: ATP-binding cassette domain-containing protein [Candidatus Omnitrophica bacterium]|nr:ATP-binding cassette domain-containing protein [Candidatus Omnitrophota bacterium]MBU4479724.1 ATP-binding cassette domain-containing protein [Candidatus Omnitrophota bacterium]MCG2703219.1 ATP-binding cassette domain-containing protein [Candidatus Omnitrophota bacterium]
MVELRNISKSFAEQELFRDVCFTIGSNEKIGLVGRNGHGKTTLFSLINGTLHPDAGTVVVPKNYRIGWLEQTIRFSKDTVLAEVCLGLLENERDAFWKAEKVLHGLGFSNADMQRHPREFSGGFQVRINLAKILVSEANLLLLDEPNNYLDVVAIRWLIRFLREWSAELVLITHDRGFMDTIVTHIVGIHRRSVRKIKGTTERFYQQIVQEEDVYEKTRLRDARKRRKTELFISKFRAKARQAGMAQSRIKTLEKQQIKEKLDSVETLDFSFTAAAFAAPVMLSVEGLGFSYDKSRPGLFEDISFNAGRKERLCVIGKNGKGKSTLLRLLAGELPPVSGVIKPHPKLEVGYYAQANVAQLNPERSVLEEIMSAAPNSLPQRARAVSGALMFSQDLALKPVRVLSGGEKSRVLLGKILMKPCNLLLLDEPTNHLDMESSEALCAAIEAFEGSVIMVTHNEYFLERIAERLIVFDENGARCFEGGYRDFLEQVGWQDEDFGSKMAVSEANALTQRQLRKRRSAQLRQERSRVLAPLEKEIEHLEKRISGLEEELRKTNEGLIIAAQRCDPAAIAGLSRLSKELPRGIDAQYAKLDAVFRDYESRREEFNRELADIDKEDSEQ